MTFRNAFYYDHRSNLTCVLDPQNGLTYYTYDAGNRMTSLKNPWGEVTYYEYSPGGRMTQRLLGNGAVTYYNYDTKGQTSKVENLKSDLSVISSFEYTRDKLGNPRSIVREDGYTTYYEYDAKSQLIGELQRDGQGQDVYAWTWDYDPAGNRTVQTFNGVATYYDYNAANELVSETTGTETTYYGYDACGNTTVQQAPAGTTYYHWDYENLLKQIDLPGDAHNYFSYDADSKRVTKEDSAGFTRFIYQGPDMLKLLQEQDEDGDLIAHYTMGNGLEAMRRDGASSFYHFDWLGSTFELTDQDEDVTDSYLYNAWGEVLDRTGITENPHGYVGKERYYLLSEAVLYLLGLRWYGAQRARFITVDPSQPVSWAYVANHPTVSIDPEGLQEIGIIGPSRRILCCLSRHKGQQLEGYLNWLRGLWQNWVNSRGTGGQDNYGTGATDWPYMDCRPGPMGPYPPGRGWIHMDYASNADPCKKYCAILHEMHHAWQCQNWGSLELYRRYNWAGFDSKVQVEEPAWRKQMSCLEQLIQRSRRKRGDGFWYTDCFRQDNWASAWDPRLA